MPSRRTRRERGAGTIRQLPSGRWQARYRAADGTLTAAPRTFHTRLDASTWLDGVLDDDIDPTASRAVITVAEHTERWMTQRELKPKTRSDYRRLLDTYVLPELGTIRLSRLTPARVREWYAGIAPGRPTTRARTYQVVHAILQTALEDDLIDANPCRVRGGGQVRATHEAIPATLAELEIIVASLPQRYRAMALLAAWCGLRYGELTELRRMDIDLDGGRIKVRRGVTRVDGTYVVGEPKTSAGRRTVAIPPHLVPTVRQHLLRHIPISPDAMLFPARHGGHMATSAFYRVWYPARNAAGRPDLHFHDLRHTGATLAAAAGATIAELMNRLGHSSAGAAMRYQHAASERDDAIAVALSAFAADGVVGLRR